MGKKMVKDKTVFKSLFHNFYYLPQDDLLDKESERKMELNENVFNLWRHGLVQRRAVQSCHRI
jgi:hypothetical protein